MFSEYDVIVVGGGHAGCEAAHAAATMGSSVLLVTMSLQQLGTMSCNPAMGGIAKGQIVREIDALGGMSGIISDVSTIQFRMLNRSKGPGMWSPRSQNDRMLFSAAWRDTLEKNERIHFWQDMVVGLIVSRGTVIGVKTQMGHEIKAKSVVLTNGTFLNGVIHIGRKQQTGGRIGEKAATGITEQLVELGFQSNRLKTGTPPRIDGRSLDYSVMEIQEGDKDVVGFSFLPGNKINAEQQRHCWITHTNPKVHEILREGFVDSPMFNGDISGTGPRYCPSVEDKVNRFSEKDSHQLFVEPEGWNTVEIYVNGFSTSLSEEIQVRALRAVKGFEHCRFFRLGYAIEYDYFPPTQLNNTLQTKLISGLFFAGQINGTTGYEEAACQGLVAGINAHQYCVKAKPLVLGRDQAYIGVLIDDLINKGTDEPYRMFTSRAEFRTLLRQDNADFRLTPIGHNLGLASDERFELMKTKQGEVLSIKKILDETTITPDAANGLLQEKGSSSLNEKTKLVKLLLRPNIGLTDLTAAIPQVNAALTSFGTLSLEQAEIQLKYQTYIEKEQLLAERMLGLDSLRIPSGFDFNRITALGTEARQKLQKIRPETIGQASRISGINPTDVQILMVNMGR
ncbi:MAG: tRNA uridine-5-carboxymethylaminomethyl(34) synthesis enzyme MnmG [Chitinophagaceae bacterium]